MGAQTANQQSMVDGIASFDQVLVNMQRRDHTSMANKTSRTPRLQRARDAVSLM